MTTCGYDYNTLLIFQERDGRNNEALQTLEALQKVVVAETGEETPMEELGEKESNVCPLCSCTVPAGKIERG